MENYTKEQAIKSGHKYLYVSVHGWTISFATEPDASTPTGVLWNQGFPRVARIHNGQIKPSKKRTIK